MGVAGLTRRSAAGGSFALAAATFFVFPAGIAVGFALGLVGTTLDFGAYRATMEANLAGTAATAALFPGSGAATAGTAITPECAALTVAAAKTA
ncbi:MAG TPA: hypothetical protein VN631_16535 [Negativicutes bacterium]|nr:hypothetical protein [Negativicutes bacterium]